MAWAFARTSTHTLHATHAHTCSLTLAHIRRFSCLWCLLDSHCSLPPAVSTRAHPSASVWSLNTHLGCILLLLLIRMQHFLLFIQLPYRGTLTVLYCRFTLNVGRTHVSAAANLLPCDCVCIHGNNCSTAGPASASTLLLSHEVMPHTQAHSSPILFQRNKNKLYVCFPDKRPLVRNYAEPRSTFVGTQCSIIRQSQ